MEYIQDIIFALARLPQDDRDTFEISLIANRMVDRDFIESMPPHLKQVQFMKQIAHEPAQDVLLAGQEILQLVCVPGLPSRMLKCSSYDPS